MATRILLARHGETTWNREHRLQGRTDTELSERGRAQARSLAALLAGERLDAIYTSTLRRTRDTAAPLAARLQLEVQPRAELDEISYGVLEGHTPDDPDPYFRDLWAQRRADPLRFRAPEGETYEELQARLEPFVREVLTRHADGHVLVVGHRATNRLLWGLFLGRSLAECLAFKPKQDRILELLPGARPDFRERFYPSHDVDAS